MTMPIANPGASCAFRVIARGSFGLCIVSQTLTIALRSCTLANMCSSFPKVSPDIPTVISGKSVVSSEAHMQCVQVAAAPAPQRARFLPRLRQAHPCPGAAAAAINNPPEHKSLSPLRYSEQHANSACRGCIRAEDGQDNRREALRGRTGHHGRFWLQRLRRRAGKPVW